MHTRWWFVFLAGAALSLGGCGSGGVGCDASIPRSGVEVSVYDARTGRPAAEGAVGTITDDHYTETLSVTGEAYSDPSGTGPTVPVVLGSAGIRAGTYTVRVEKAGYAPWERRGRVVLSSEPCSNVYLRFRADLEPFP